MKTIKLSDTERDTIDAILSTDDIRDKTLAKILNISKSTVHYRINALKNKYGLSNKYELIVFLKNPKKENIISYRVIC